MDSATQAGQSIQEAGKGLLLMALNQANQEAIIGVATCNTNTMRDQELKEEEKAHSSSLNMRSFLWHCGSVYDAWFSCASNQVAQVLLMLLYSLLQLVMTSGIVLQAFYGIMGSWTVYLINVLCIQYQTRKAKENVSFNNHVIQWFEVLNGLLGPYWKAIGLVFNYTFLLFGSVIQLIGCARASK